MFQKQKRKKTHEEIQFYNLIQDGVFNTVRGLKVLGKMPDTQELLAKRELDKIQIL